MTRLMILAALAVALSATSTSSSARCIMSYCKGRAIQRAQNPVTRLAIFALAVTLTASPADARCIMSYCKDGATSNPATPTCNYITNTSRQIIGDLYSRGHGRRIQIRDKHRRILGYIEADGTVTNTRRQKVGTLN